MRSRLALVSLLLAAATACKKAPPDANPEFSDALVYVFRSFEGEEADLAYAVRNLEEQIYLNMDLDASNSLDRALSPTHLTAEDVGDLERPQRNLADALPVAVAGRSAWPVEDHRLIAMLSDHTVVEPYSPDYFERTFLEGDDCWFDRECEVMKTHNDLIKDNVLLTIPYWFYKDYRWVDLGLPDPADVPDGEEAVNTGEPRWALVARSWTTETFSGDSGKNTIMQSFTIELWVPMDDGGTLRLLSLWGETELGGLNVSDDTVAGTTRVGIDQNFDAQEEWLDENHGT
jgi:hypothetical protein